MADNPGFWCCKCSHRCTGDTCCLAHSDRREWLSGEDLARFVQVALMGPFARWGQVANEQG